MTSPRFLLYQLLHQKKTGWLIILIATASKSILTAFFSSYETDKSYYLLLAKNLWAGEGFTIPVTLLSNPAITENVYLPSAISPLYSIIAAPLLGLFPDQYIFVTWLVESLSWLLLFIVLRKLLLRVTQDHFRTNLFILFSGFFLYGIELSSPSKDMLAIALLFASLLRCMNIGEPGKRPSFSYLAVTAVLFLLPGLVKYTYLPLAVAFPFSLLFLGYLQKEKQLLRSGMITLFLSVLLVGAHYLYFHSLEAQALLRHADFYSNRLAWGKSENDFITGFYPGNLQNMYPFIPASLVNLTVLGVQVKTQFYPFYNTYVFLLFTFHFIALALYFSIFFYLSKRYYRKAIPGKMFFLLTGLFISITIVVLLSALSLRYQAIVYKGANTSWTYVYESRAYLFIIIFLQLCLFAFLTNKQRPGILSWLRAILLVVAGISFLHGIYFLGKNIFSLREPAQKRMSVNRLATHETDSLQKANPGSVVWLATEMPHVDWYAKLHHQKVLNNISFLNDSSFRLPIKTILLTVVLKEDTSKISAYLRRADVKDYRNYDNTYFIFRQDSP